MADPIASTQRDRAAHTLAHVAQRREAVLAGNGVTALWSVFASLELAPGTPVLYPDLTCERAAAAASLAGLVPLYADVQRETAMPSPADLAVAAAAGGAGAMVPTHLLGHRGRLATPDPACPQIIDATQCAPAPDVLSGGLAAVISFATGRQLDLGGGAAVLTDDPVLAAAVRCHLAKLDAYDGDPLQPAPAWLSALLVDALDRVGDVRRRRRVHGRLLCESLAGIDGVTPLDLAETDVPWRVGLRIPAHRDTVQRDLTRAGFDAVNPFAPLHRLAGRPDREYPRASALADDLLTLDPIRLGTEPVLAARRAAAVITTALDRPLHKEEHAGV